MNMTRLCTLISGALALFAGPAFAHDYAIGGLEIAHPYAFATAPTARTGAGYMTIRNGGAEPDRLIAVRAAFPQVMLHVTEVDAAGIARMSHVDSVEIPPGGEVTLAPQGLHVMFVGLDGPLEAGDTIDAVLVFETAGEVAVAFNVEPRGEVDPHAGH